MAFSIKDLLGDSLRRNHISAQVTSARIIEESDKALAFVLPKGREGDAKTQSVKEYAITIACLNAPAAHRIASYEREILDRVVRALPTADVRQVKTILTQRFSDPRDLVE